AYTEVCGATTRTRGPSTLALHPPGEVHADHWHGERVRVFHVELSLSRLEQVRASSPVLDSPADFQGGLSEGTAGPGQRAFLPHRRPVRERTIVDQGAAGAGGVASPPILPLGDSSRSRSRAGLRRFSRNAFADPPNSAFSL